MTIPPQKIDIGKANTPEEFMVNLSKALDLMLRAILLMTIPPQKIDIKQMQREQRPGFFPANPLRPPVPTRDPQFARYGTLHPTIHLPEMRQFLYSVERTEFEHYVPCEERLMSLPFFCKPS